MLFRSVWSLTLGKRYLSRSFNRRTLRELLDSMEAFWIGRHAGSVIPKSAIDPRGYSTTSTKQFPVIIRKNASSALLLVPNSRIINRKSDQNCNVRSRICNDRLQFAEVWGSQPCNGIPTGYRSEAVCTTSRIATRRNVIHPSSANRV